MSTHLTWFIGYLGAWALVWASGLAYGGTISSSLDRTEGEVGEPLVMTVTIEGSRSGDLEVPEVDGLVIQQRGVSQSMSFVNGQSRQELIINYLVQATQPGTFTIPSMSLELDGKKESTLPLTITINKPSASTAQAPKQKNAPANKALEGAAAQNATGILIERECEKAQVYVGEQMTCTVRIYHRGNLAGGQRLGQNSTDYRRLAIEGEKQYQKVVRGQRYAVIELQEIFIPLKEGRISLAPFELDARVVAWNRRGNPLDKFFDRMGGGMFNFDMAFTEESQVLLRSEPTVLEVKGLPSLGKPADFSGLVGQYQLSAQKSADRVAAGDTVTITIQLEGTGLLDTAPSPLADISKYGKVYADKPEYKEQLDAKVGVRSAKIFKYAFVPAQAGQVTLPPVDLTVFNPRIGQYVTLHGDLGQLIVDPAKAEQKPLVVGQTSPVGTSQQDVKSREQELLGLHRDDDLGTSQTLTRFEKMLWFTLSGLAFVGPFFALSLTTWHSRRHADTTTVRRSRAWRDFRRQIDASQKTLQAGEGTQALHQAYLALRTYMGDKCGKQGPALTGREIDALLGEMGAHADQRQRAQEFIQACEKMAFGGMQPSGETANALIGRVATLVEELEKT